MDLTTILTQMLVLFFLMILGLIAQRFGIMDQTFNARLSNLLIKLAVPCMILASVGRQNPFSDAGALIRVLTVSALVNAAAPFLAHLFVRLLRVKEERNLYQFMFSLTNAGFMGLPVIQSIFGDTAMDYAAIFLLPNNFLAYVYGIRLFQKQVRLKWKQVFNSPVVCSILACGISLFHLQEPAIVYQLTDMVGDITTPLAMLIIGASLAKVSKKELLQDRRLLPFTLIKMLVIPLLYDLVLRLFVSDETLRIVCVMMMAMPVATNAVIFSSAYGGNTALSCRCVFVTSTVSVVTIPLLCLLFL